jgi:hypothetical protein
MLLYLCLTVVVRRDVVAADDVGRNGEAGKSLEEQLRLKVAVPAVTISTPMYTAAAYKIQLNQLSAHDTGEDGI